MQKKHGRSSNIQLLDMIAVHDEVKIWQNWSLDAVYPIAYMDAIRVKGRATGHILNKAVYLAIGITMDGVKEVLGMWVAETEGAKFWLKVVTELRNRGVQDIFIACVDGLELFFHRAWRQDADLLKSGKMPFTQNYLHIHRYKRYRPADQRPGHLCFAA